MRDTSPSPRARQPRWLWLFLGLTLALGLLVAALIPPWQGPDETGHFEYVWLLTHLGRLPTKDDLSPAFEQELIGSLYEWRYGELIRRPLPEEMPARLEDLPGNILARNARTVPAERFSLSYIWMGAFVALARNQDLVTQLYFARLASVLIAVAGCWVAYRCAELLWPKQRPLVLLAMTIYTLIPQRVYVNSMVGDGPLAELLALGVFACWVNLFRGGHPLRCGIGILLATLAALATKNTAAFLLPLDALAGLAWLTQSALWKQSTKRGWILAGALLALIAAVGVWSRLPLGARALRVATRALGAIQQGELLLVDVRGITLLEAFLLAFQSFWVNYGWMSLPLNERWYGALLLLTIAGLGGWLLRRAAPDPAERRIALLALGACALAGAAFTWSGLLSQPTHFQYQGRYLFPVAMPAISLWVSGLKRYFKSAPPWGVSVAAGAFLALLNVWSWARYVVPYFYS